MYVEDMVEEKGVELKTSGYVQNMKRKQGSTRLNRYMRDFRSQHGANGMHQQTREKKSSRVE